MAVSRPLRAVAFAFSLFSFPAAHALTLAVPPSSSSCRIRPVPDRVLIGYATTCDDRVVRAVRQGVNVVVWAFMSLKPVGSGFEAVTSLDLDCIKETIDELDAAGFDDTLHLVSFGGWNGDHLHLDDVTTAEVWYRTWKSSRAGRIFHGLDWDLEGTDDVSSDRNVFTLSCLDGVGRISQLARADGYVVSMAPAQSYLDVSSSRFSRYLNLTDVPSDFPHFGANGYAYVLAKFGSDVVDIISMQFYESYSRAAKKVFWDGMDPAAYLEEYNRHLAAAGESYFVDFDDDETLVDLPSQRVSVPLSKIVWGFANGWALDHPDQEKVVFFGPDAVGRAYAALASDGIAPRGMMFWLIDGEGSNGVRLIPGLNEILRIREKKGSKPLTE